ncbi:MAG: isoprenyl transferase [Flavobacteriales bacterium]|nr:isoprenyl transferase [Flavobacteriales bacterium]MBO73281.1 isoprenyl transferase [Flavobacteriales bacterium]|tara:strand:- start:219 stop:968 length:750 start_codon:yes stop_codon:yes gene_type:complete
MAEINEVNNKNIPKHVAIIMDGNGRWAKQKGKLRVFGHKNGVKAVQSTIEGAAKVGINYITLYAFSTENWNRPQFEVNALMELLVDTIQKEIATLNKNKIRLQAIGDLNTLPKKAREKLQNAIDKTAQNEHMTLILALSYSSKWEIINAVKEISNQVASGNISSEEINEKLIDNSLSTVGIPHPELMIRTSGEHRISNFLLWQLAYAELYFTPKLWPDFREQDLYDALLSFQKRERRFGKTSEQITEPN